MRETKVNLEKRESWKNKIFSWNFKYFCWHGATRAAQKKIKASPSALYDRLTLERRPKEKSDLQMFWGCFLYLMDETKTRRRRKAVDIENREFATPKLSSSRWNSHVLVDVFLLCDVHVCWRTSWRVRVTIASHVSLLTLISNRNYAP